MKLAIQGTCLCNTVQLGVARMPRQVTQCSCSVCRRYGTLWAYYPRSSVLIEAPRGALEEFSRRPRGLKFGRCKSCGCVIYWDSRRRDPDRRMGINMRNFDHARMADVPISVLDGDLTWRVVDKYVKPSIWVSPKRKPEPPATRPSGRRARG